MSDLLLGKISLFRQSYDGLISKLVIVSIVLLSIFGEINYVLNSLFAILLFRVVHGGNVLFWNGIYRIGTNKL